MVTEFEVLRRAINGDICSESNFDLHQFSMTLKQIVAKYDIKYDASTPIPWDDNLADRVWQAGKELFIKVGVYCRDSERVIKFNQEEIDQAIKDSPKKIILGEGKEAKQFPIRRPDSEIIPWCSLGAAGGPVSSESLFSSLIQAYAEFTSTDSIPTPSLTHVDGYPIIAGTPLEIEGCIRTVRFAKDAVRRAGRPGLCLANLVATGVKAEGHIAGHSMGACHGDMMEIGAIAELKTDYDILSKVAYMTTVGGYILGETGPVLGGYCGGPEGTAVTLTAYHFFSSLILRASIHHPFCVHFNIKTSTPRDVLWVRSIANQAISRNSDIGLLNVGLITAGPATGMSLYECAAYTLASVTSGGSVEGTGAARSAYPDYLSPMEPLFVGEVAHAATRISRKDANRIVIKLLDKFESNLNNPPVGKRYQDCYDAILRKPGKEALDYYIQARKELKSLGIDFQDASPYL